MTEQLRQTCSPGRALRFAAPPSSSPLSMDRDVEGEAPTECRCNSRPGRSTVIEEAIVDQPADSEGLDVGKLTERDKHVLCLLARGMSNRRIAAALGIAPRTVLNSINAAYGNLRVHSRVELSIWVRERNLIDS